jgi:hypothetical protein
VAVNGSGKQSSLLQYGSNYWCKSFKVPALGHFFNLFSANLQREEKILEASVTPGTGSINLSVLVIDSLA